MSKRLSSNDLHAELNQFLTQEESNFVLNLKRDKMLGAVSESELNALNLHMPMHLTARTVWRKFKEMLNADDKQAFEFLKSTQFSSNAHAAHEMYESVENMIKALKYNEAISALQTVLSFNVYNYDWAQFYKLHTLEDQRDQLVFLLEDATDKFKDEMTQIDGTDDEAQILIQALNTTEDKKDIEKLASMYKKTIESRSKRIFHFLYVLNTTIGNIKLATYYDQRKGKTVFDAYAASHDAITTGRKVFNIRTQFRTNQTWTIEWLVDLIHDAADCQSKYAFLLQYSTLLKWTDSRIRYDEVLKLMSPDHPMNRLVQYVSNELFPDETNLDKARDFVSSMMDSFRSHREPKQSVEQAIIAAKIQPSNLAASVDAQVKAFAPNPNLPKAIQYLNRSVRAKEDLWPGESEKRSTLARLTDFTNLTENLPYLDGEYTLNIFVRVHLLEDTNKLLQLKDKTDKTCDDKKEEAKLLGNLLYGKAKKGIINSITNLFKSPEASTQPVATTTPLVPASIPSLTNPPPPLTSSSYKKSAQPSSRTAEPTQPMPIRQIRQTVGGP